jgi:hypothetical protein
MFLPLTWGLFAVELRLRNLWRFHGEQGQAMASCTPALPRVLRRSPASGSSVCLDVLPRHDTSTPAAPGTCMLLESDHIIISELTFAWQVYGAFQLVDEYHKSIFAYARLYAGEIYLVVLNFGSRSVKWEMPQTHSGRWSVVMSTSRRAPSDQELMTKLRLGPYDGIICRQKGM